MAYWVRKIVILHVYVFFIFLIPFFPHRHELYQIPLVLSVVLASLLHLFEPQSDNKDTDKTFYINTVMFIATLLLPMVDHVYIQMNFTSNAWIGFVIALLGLSFRIYSIRYLGKQFTTKVKIVDDHELIDHGPYKKVRHPSYTGTLIMLLGNALIYGSWIGLVGIVCLMIPAYFYRIKVEEKALSEFFGQKYVDYIARTRPFL